MYQLLLYHKMNLLPCSSAFLGDKGKKGISHPYRQMRYPFPLMSFLFLIKNAWANYKTFNIWYFETLPASVLSARDILYGKLPGVCRHSFRT